MKSIDRQTIRLIEMIAKIPILSSTFEKEGSAENIKNLAEIVEISEKEFGILKQMLADMIDDTGDVVEVIETDNGFQIGTDLEEMVD